MHAMGHPADTERLAQAPIFENLEQERVLDIVGRSRTVCHPRGVRVLSRGDRLDGLFVVLSGQLKLFMLSCSGTERVLQVVQAGESFGEAFMFKQIPSPVYVDTLRESELAFLPSEAIIDALRKDPDFVFSMLRNLSGLMELLIIDLETACMQNALQRTVNYLLREAERSPAPHIGLTMSAPKAVVASTLNLSAETFSRELHRLQHHGYIKIERRVIKLADRNALRALANGQSLETSPG